VISLARDAFKKPEPQPNGHQQQHQPAIPAATSTTTTTAEPTAKPVDQMTDDEKRKHVDELWKKWGLHLLSISTRLVEEFTIQDQGYSFRDWYVKMYGMFKWADLKRDIVPELMCNMYLAHEQLKKALSPPERLTMFLQQFFTNEGEEQDVTVVEEGSAHVEPREEVQAGKPTEAKAK
jgi:hypothetical protein